MARQEREGEMLDEDLEALRELSREELKRRWHRLYGSACPARVSRIFLVRALAHRMQEQALGGLARATRCPLARAAEDLVAKRTPAPSSPKIKPGTRLLREWQGVVHEVNANARAPERRPGDQIVQSWDTASKASKTNDFSVCTTRLLRGADYYLLDVLRQRLEYPDLRRRILAHAEAHGAKVVLIEDASSGAPLIQDLWHEGNLRPIPIRPEGDKIVRLEGQSAVIEAGHVLLPETAPWLGDFQLEILAFPYGHYDDQVDSLSQFLTWAAAKRRRRQTSICGGKLFPVDLPDGWTY